MTDEFKKKIILSLSDFLPPLVESIMKLLEHVKKEEDLYNEDLFYKLVEITYYSGEVTRSFGDELEEISEKNEHDLTMDEREFLTLYSDYVSAFDNINKGICAFIYLFILSKDIQEKVKDRDWYQSIISKQKDPSVEVAVDNLYEGSKMLINIIDIIID